MAKGDQATTMQDVKKSRAEQSGNYYDYLNNVKKQGEGVGDQARNERNQLWQTGTDYTATGGISPEAAARLRGTTNGAASGGGGGGGGGMGSTGNYGNPPGSAFNYVGPSAYNDVNWNFDDARGVYNQLGNQQGGLNEEQLGNINRDTLKEFEKTGGYNDSQLADIRARSNSTVPAFYQSIQDQMGRNRLSQGGYSTGFDAASAKAARQGAQDSAEQTRNTEIGLGDTVRKGRFDASSKLADLGLSTADLISRNRLGAAGGLASIDLNDAQLKMMKAKGIDDYTIQVATGKDRYATTEDQIAAQKAIAGAGLNLQKMALDAQNERFLISSQQQGQQFGMGNLGDLYRSANGPQEAFNRDLLAGIQGLSGYSNQNLGLQAGLSQQPGNWAQGFGNLFSGLGAASGGLSGLGGMSRFLPMLFGRGSGNTGSPTSDFDYSNSPWGDDYYNPYPTNFPPGPTNPGHE